VTLDYANARGFDGKGLPSDVQMTSLDFSEKERQRQRQHFEQLLPRDAPSLDRLAEKPFSCFSPLPADFSRFKAQFEAQNPEQAKALQDNLRPKHEKMALEAEKHFHQLEKAQVHSNTPRRRQQQLEKYAATLAKQVPVMGYLQQHNQPLSDKIQKLAKSHQRTLDKGQEISR